MATDQGKTSNMGGLAIMAEIAGKVIPDVGTTIFRPPYTPVAIGALAGRMRGMDFHPHAPDPSPLLGERARRGLCRSGQLAARAVVPD